MSYIYRFIHIIILHCVDAESRRPDASDASASFYLICLSSDPLSLCSPSAAGEGRGGPVLLPSGQPVQICIFLFHLSIYVSIFSSIFLFRPSIYVSTFPSMFLLHP